ncbi:MAG: hypothetical protein IJV37_05435 [Bacteroidales bacterium]|nr:hypothetical protein [Bacteroidales bacterium]
MTQKRRLARFRALTRNVSTSTTVGLWLCMIVSIGMFIASLFIPPQGEIHPTVLQAVGWIFAFAGLFELREAIREGLGFKLTHGKTTVEVKDLDGKGSSENNETTEDNEEA